LRNALDHHAAPQANASFCASEYRHVRAESMAPDLQVDARGVDLCLQVLTIAAERRRILAVE